jgi:hypothetical protein
MKRFILCVAVPALMLLGCSSDEPQKSVKVSGSASVTPPSSDPKVVGSETKAGARTTSEVETYRSRDDGTATRTEVEVKTRSDSSSATDVKPVRPVDSSNAGKPAIKPVDGTLSPSGSVDVTAKSDATRGYFETTKDGKTYVFSTSAAMKRFNDGDDSIRFTTKTGPNGERYFVETDRADSLSAEYNKAHPGK